MQSRNERPQYMNHTSTGEPREVAQASHPNLETKVKKAKNSKNLIYSPGNRLVKTQNTLVVFAASTGSGGRIGDAV